MERAFTQVDVFTTTPYAGNPVAVVLDGAGLSTEEMQRFANWTNLSETTFVLPPTAPEADYLVRIFTPVRELPFAGHPTLGTCHAWLTVGGGTPKQADLVVQECAAGLIEVRQLEHGLAFAAPPLLRSGAVDEALLERIADGLRLEPVGDPGRRVGRQRPALDRAAAADSDAVLALSPASSTSTSASSAAPRRLARGVRGARVLPEGRRARRGPGDGQLQRLARAVAPAHRARTRAVHRPPGHVLGRSGRVHVSTDAAGTIWVGGGTIACITGTVEL